MSEPSVNFDWDAIDRDASEITEDERRVIAEQAIRRTLELVMTNKSLRRSRGPKWLAIRAHLAALILRIPGHERFGGVTGIAKTFGANRAAVQRLKTCMRRKMLGLKERGRA